jgi:hypothetical protein
MPYVLIQPSSVQLGSPIGSEAPLEGDPVSLVASRGPMREYQLQATPARLGGEPPDQGSLIGSRAGQG